MDVSQAKADAKAHWVSRQPLLFGLVAAGGVGLYSVVQMASQPQAEDGPAQGSPKENRASQLASLPSQAPAPEFGQVASVAAEARIGGTAVNRAVNRAGKPRLTSVAAPARLLGTAAPRLLAYPQRLSLPEIAMAQSRGKRRHTGSFAVPSASEANLALGARQTLPQSIDMAPQAATLVAYQPAPQSVAPAPLAMPAMSAQPDSLADAQLAPRSLAPADQSASTALVVTPAEDPHQQSAARTLLPDLQSGTSPAPADSGAAPLDANPASPIVYAPGSTQRSATTSRLVPSQPQGTQSGTARVAAVRPAQPTESPLALASPADKSGFEGLAGLDDSRLAEVRPILGETRQQAASAKRRGSPSGGVRPSARRQTVEDAAPNPDKISAAGSAFDRHFTAQVNGRLMGDLTVQIAADSTISLHLGELLSLVEGQMDSNLFKSLMASPAADSKISMAALRTAGINLRYVAARNQIVVEVSQA